eukprot:scaffold24976_cov39-Phaeocystis_antarctica.AAC.1
MHGRTRARACMGVQGSTRSCKGVRGHARAWRGGVSESPRDEASVRTGDAPPLAHEGIGGLVAPAVGIHEVGDGLARVSGQGQGWGWG